MSLSNRDLFDIAGKTALVTGASVGIGAMIASAMAANGARVWICARKREGLEALRQRLGGIGECNAIVADLSTPEGLSVVATTLEREVSALDILVNNAGATWGAPLGAYPRAGFEKVLNLNVLAPFELTQLLLPLLREAARERPPARIINISSVDGISPPSVDSFGYSSSKAAVIMLTRHLAKTLAGEAITVNCIAPGIFPSRMTAVMLDETHPQHIPPPQVPLGRLGEAEDMAGAILYLSSRAGAFVTGAVLPVSGGQGTVS